MGYIFDGLTKIVTLTPGTVVMSVRDVWSRWVDWLLTGDNSKYPIAMLNVGGDDIDQSAGTKIPIFVFLQNGWKIKPQESNHTLNVTDGILLVGGGGDPFVNTIGSYVVRINYQQPVQAISFSSDGGTGASAADVWGYAARSLTDKDGFAPSSADIVTAILASVIEGSMSLQQALKIMLSGFAGKTSGGGTTQIKFRDIEDTVDRIIATVDENGNRSVVNTNV